ncbi:MAG: ABC transporter ATP-binding protein [Proteobacteria bacterium]|nr:ABC transporter ATP-binding protein [Pseudomonadota bacterium]
MPALITLENLTVKYGKTLALHDVSGALATGSLTAIAGPNGSGKSTMLKAIAGIVKPAGGRVRIAEQTGPIAYLPQTTSIRRDFPITVFQAVATGLYPSLGDFGAITAAHRQKISAALNEVGLDGFEKRQINHLSGGQFQRLLFARIIVQEARVILLDEPFTAVDAETTAKLIQILLQWHKEGRTIVCALHDLLLIKKYFPDSFVLAGKCLGRGHTHKMFEQKLLSFDLDMAELYPESEAPHPHGHDHPHDHAP